MTRPFFQRDFEAPAQIETFVVAAVSVILATRLFLHLSGYPAVGGATIHLAHLLWGGLLMLVGFVLVLSFLGRAASRLAALLGGLGFGLFIDEVGKFVTRDNDYFYQPAVALIYVTFVLVFLTRHAIHGRGGYRSDEYLLNALRETEEYARLDLDEVERRRALEYLERADPVHPLTGALRDALTRAAVVGPRAPGPVTRIRAAVRRLYGRLAALPGFDLALIVFFVGQLVVKLAFGALLIFVLGVGPEHLLDVAYLGRVVERLERLSGLEVAQLAASGLSAAFIVAGVVRLRRARLSAYSSFERAILVSILLVQPFSFYAEQFAALVELAFNLSVLAALRAVIRLEEERAGPPGTP
ncbi:MAG TPA: hypothetical protein VM778_09440 [Gemmatimonadota bacterium]|nr:hypothetical protein [Gemmatimonadota bacterium]